MRYFYITTILLKTFLRCTWISFIFRLQVLSGGLYNLVFCNQECNSSILMHKIANLCTNLIDLVQFSLSAGWQVDSQPWHDKMYLHLHQEWNMTHIDQTQWGNYWNSQSEWGTAGSTVGDRRGAEDSKWLKIFSFFTHLQEEYIKSGLSSIHVQILPQRHFCSNRLHFTWKVFSQLVTTA